ncbi:hypothetical protein C2845_PM08G25280 [Panicum miliaceum]|uniref:Uncharacterized protein n=1 Tax=Panicum miliaceum TaxID=4540 RepID=A0A3L6R3M1_PANMI|nr:hypothetical protein C2845_PM08G25280 [Panicum miliaceum]
MAWPPFGSRVLQRGQRPARPRGASRRGAAPRLAAFAAAEARQPAAAQDHGPSHARRPARCGGSSAAAAPLPFFSSVARRAAQRGARGGLAGGVAAWRVLVRCASSSSVVLCGGTVRRGTRTEAAARRTGPLEGAKSPTPPCGGSLHQDLRVKNLI